MQTKHSLHFEPTIQTLWDVQELFCPFLKGAQYITAGHDKDATRCSFLSGHDVNFFLERLVERRELHGLNPQDFFIGTVQIFFVVTWWHDDMVAWWNPSDRGFFRTRWQTPARQDICEGAVHPKCEALVSSARFVSWLPVLPAVQTSTILHKGLCPHELHLQLIAVSFRISHLGLLNWLCLDWLPCLQLFQVLLWHFDLSPLVLALDWLSWTVSSLDFWSQTFQLVFSSSWFWLMSLPVALELHVLIATKQYLHPCNQQCHAVFESWIPCCCLASIQRIASNCSTPRHSATLAEAVKQKKGHAEMVSLEDQQSSNSSCQPYLTTFGNMLEHVGIEFAAKLESKFRY